MLASHWLRQKAEESVDKNGKGKLQDGIRVVSPAGKKRENISYQKKLMKNKMTQNLQVHNFGQNKNGPLSLCRFLPL